MRFVDLKWKIALMAVGAFLPAMPARTWYGGGRRNGPACSWKTTPATQSVKKP